MESPKLLIVDDDLSTRLILENIFKKDYQLFLSADGEDALELAQEERPDLILLDIMMPGIDGYEVNRRLQEHSVTKEIPVIFLTALDSVQQEEHGLKIGAVDYVSKPIQPEIVRLRVKTHLMLRRQSEQLRRQAEQLALLADLDGLTGILNRRAFDRELLKEMNRSARVELPMSLLLIDIDFFKAYNDTYGHLLGDKCLQKVALSLQNALPRKTDLIARYGGEEFSCVLFNTDHDGLKIVSERLSKAVSYLQIPHLGSDSKYISVSMGGCSFTPRNLTRPEDVLECADRHLYQAKNSGRHKIVLCEGADNCLVNTNQMYR